MNEPDNFALVRRPSAALEKVESGAKRILPGMVADALALVKKESPQKPTFTVLLGLDHFAGMMELVLASKLGETYNLRFMYFARSSELLKLAELNPFDLVFMYIGNVVWDMSSDDGSWQGAASILGELKTRYGKPIVATQGLELSAELEPRGVIFLTAPFTIENFCARLQPLIPALINDRTPKHIFAIAICGLNPGHELDRFFFALPVQEILGREYAVTLHYFASFHQCDATMGGSTCLSSFLTRYL